MFFDDLAGAKKAVQQLGNRAGLDASAKKHLAKIADNGFDAGPGIAHCHKDTCVVLLGADQ